MASLFRKGQRVRIDAPYANVAVNGRTATVVHVDPAVADQPFVTLRVDSERHTRTVHPAWLRPAPDEDTPT